MAGWLNPQGGGAFLITRSWNWVAESDGARQEGPLHRLQLRHNQISGSRYLVVDGVEVPGTRGTSTVGDLTALQFRCFGDDVLVEINAEGIPFRYACTRNGFELTEANDVTGDPVAQVTRYGGLACWCVCVCV